MKKKKNAFTLIELLAVIVILAIIALIATPIILGIVEDAKKDAFLRSVELLVSTTDIDIGSKNFEEEYTYEITDGNISNLEVSVKNTDGMNGNIIYDIEGKEQYAIHNGVYCVKKTSNMSKAEISDYDGNCSLEINQKCFAFSDGTITDYYDYEDNDSSKSECPRDVVIPETINGEKVIAIGNGAFKTLYDENFNIQYETQITSVKFPSTLESIGNSAFFNNKLSGELDLSNTNLTSIGVEAFANLFSKTSGNKITSVKFPNTLESIGHYAFNFNALSGELDLSMYTNLTSVNGFSNNQITSIKLPNSVTNIEENAFEHNALSGELDLSMYTNLTSVSGFGSNEITSVKFPNSVTNIEERAFEYNALSGELDLSLYSNLTNVSGFNNNEITSVKFPNTLTNIGYFAFSDNKLSGELDLSMYSNLTTISNRSFARGSIFNSANKITTLKLPSSITNIEDFAFYLDKSLTSVTFYGRSDLTGVTVGSDAWLDAWASGYDETNGIHFVNE